VAEFSARVQQAGSDKLLAAESAENLKLSDYLLRATERLNRLNQQNLRTRQQLDTLNQTDQALEEQIAVLEGSLLLSRILYQQKQALPSLQLDKNLADEIADIRSISSNSTSAARPPVTPRPTSNSCWHSRRKRKSRLNCGAR
jgi:Small-conductance mechanosensitive channel